MNGQTKVDISTSFIFKIILVLLGLWFLYIIRDIVALLVVSIIFVSAIEPTVDWLQKKKFPRAVSVLLIYLVILALISLAFSFIIPAMGQQFQELNKNYPVYSQKINELFLGFKNFASDNNLSIDTGQFLKNFQDEIASLSRHIFSTTLGVFSGIISVIAIFSLTFYMSVKEDGIKKFIISVAPKRYHDYAANLAERIKHKIGGWLIGQIFLMLIIFLLVYIGLTLAGVPYALILAIFAGFMEIIPYVGPIISAIPGVILGFIISPATGFFALLVYIISQQLENHIIAPQVMKKAVGLSPVTVILALLIGAKLGGTLGAILAIPVATSVSLMVKDYLEYRNNQKQPS